MVLAKPTHRPIQSVPAGPGVLVNDLHSRLNATRVRRVFRPRSRAELCAFVGRCRDEGRPLVVAGGRGAMGGQAFLEDQTLVDARSLDRVLDFDPQRGVIRVEAGITWPALMEATAALHRPGGPRLGVAQKQTGADALTLGGSVSANAHGRGLTLPPLVAQVEALEIVDGAGRILRASRRENAELFRLAVGGYGLFGVITAVELALVPRVKVRRRVEVIDGEGLMEAFAGRIAEGFTYGDFQVATDPAHDDFLRRGVFSCYEPVGDQIPIAAPRKLSESDWRRLLCLAHSDPRAAFQRYSTHYLATDGQVYWSDTHQLASYVRGYHHQVDRHCAAAHPGSEMITELYVPRPRFGAFLQHLRACLRERGAQLIYSTVRLIERDEETFLAWAREPWACMVLNLHVDHTPRGIERARGEFGALIEVALAHGGSFFLTYHRWASPEQVRAAHPRFEAFLAAKRAHDREGRFQSDWYRQALRQFPSAG